METMRWACILVLAEQTAEERKKALTAIWKERVGSNQTQNLDSTAKELACAVGLLDVTNQWKEEVCAQERAAMLVAHFHEKKERRRRGRELERAGKRPMAATATANEIYMKRLKTVKCSTLKGLCHSALTSTVVSVMLTRGHILSARRRTSSDSKSRNQGTLGTRERGPGWQPWNFVLRILFVLMDLRGPWPRWCLCKHS